MKYPNTQHALQLTGPGELTLNTSKPVPVPGPCQILCRVEAAGLCFSDLKLLKQFSDHPRKGHILSGIDPKILPAIPSYVPGADPVVPGHEAVVQVVAAGPGARHPVGLRALVQTDYRWIFTQGSNASFGYNFEGALQEYVLLDERIIISPEGDSMLIPVDEGVSASAVALVEPWACVENAYISPERRHALPGGRMLIVADTDRRIGAIGGTFAPGAPPRHIACLCNSSQNPAESTRLPISRIESLDQIDSSCVDEGQFDDIIYFGNSAQTIERLQPFLAPHGLLNIVRGPRPIGADVSLQVGRVHYGGIRIIGTVGDNPSESLRHIPSTPEIRPGDQVLIVGAAGPMGVMHVIRDLCQGIADIRVIATDLDSKRLAALDAQARPFALRHGHEYQSINAAESASPVPPSNYIVLMIPMPGMVAQAVADAATGAIINIFAGIPAGVSHPIDLDAFIEKRLYLVGTSGSVLRDMHVVLDKVVQGRIDTNISVAAISGMAGAAAGIHAVEDRSIPGKIIVYPELRDVGLIPLDKLASIYPSVQSLLKNGLWTAEAERELLQVAK